MKYIFFVILTALIFACQLDSSDQNQAIVKKEDYKPFLKQLSESNLIDSLKEKTQSEIAFWESKSSKQRGGFLYHEKLGRLYSELFELTGDINYIHDSNRYYNRVVYQTSGNYQSNILLSQSSNYIKLHQFDKAKEMTEKAYKGAKDESMAALMSFDALMEIGMYETAENIMNAYSDHSSFDYLVRYGKFQDYKGDLEGAIASTEKALSLLKSSELKKRLWVQTHLADMYGHRGDIQLSYDSYVNVLKEDPLNLHALRGIAWVSFSYDKNDDVALEIMQNINKLTSLPDPLLFIAEIAENKGDSQLKDHSIRQFQKEVKEQNLQDLYNTYLIDLNMDASPSEALTMAQKECKKRPTPHSYLQLAKAYHQINKSEKALAILESEVIGKSFEPQLIFESGVLLHKNGQSSIAQNLLSEAAEASYELGPLVEKELKELLKS